MATRTALLLVLILSPAVFAAEWVPLTDTSSHTETPGSPALPASTTPPPTPSASTAARFSVEAVPNSPNATATPTATPVATATPLPASVVTTGTGISVGGATPAAADVTRTAINAVLRLVGPNLVPFPPDQQAALIVALSDLLALPTDAISVISYSMRTLTFRRQLQQTSSAVDVTVELQCGTVERLGPISNMLSRVTSDGTLAANLDSRGMPLSKLLLMSTITVAPNQVSSICRLNASRQCIDSSAIGSRNQIMIAVIVPLAAIVAITMLIIYVMYRRRKTEEQIRAEEKVRPSTSNSIQIREPVVIGKSDKGKGKVFDYPMEPAVKGKWKWKDDRIVEEYHNTTGRYNFARTDSRKTVSTESLGMGSSSKDKTAEPKQGWFAKFRRGRVSKKKLNPAATASPSKSASFAKKAAAAAAAGTAGSAAAVTADSSSIKAVPGVMHIPLEQHSGNSMCSMASGGSTTYSNPAFQNSTALTHRTSRLDDLE